MMYELCSFSFRVVPFSGAVERPVSTYAKLWKKNIKQPQSKKPNADSQYTRSEAMQPRAKQMTKPLSRVSQLKVEASDI